MQVGMWPLPPTGPGLHGMWARLDGPRHREQRAKHLQVLVLNPNLPQSNAADLRQLAEGMQLSRATKGLAANVFVYMCFYADIQQTISINKLVKGII